MSTMLSSLGAHALSAIGPAHRIAQKAGFDEVADFLHPMATHKRQLEVREYGEQLQAALGSQEDGDTTGEGTEPSAAPGDGAETSAVAAPSSSDATTPIDDGDGSLLGGVGRAIHGVRGWISDAW
ncbi:protein of unknown function [Modestobacter italicus]|uniref:Uncharacterized protein n=1 Tax=Modestobacter italicus (strain DSM 44449 / CECT 9708 / BC 501) TaxID=2732864 RepID=I4EX53_MODI5|nr:hypothetical protein [Modestobacter marinus]CCH87966.1 protein of unknown function [Modestobacter marinus]